MYGGIYRWPRQSWRIDPAPIPAVRPWNQQPAVFQKRDGIISGNSTGNGTDSAMAFHVDLKAQDDADLNYDELLFLDMDGNPVDGRTCEVIYEEEQDPEDTASRVRIVVDEDGNMVDVYMTDDAADDLWPPSQEAPSASSATATAEAVTITATATGAARPASGETTPALPASTAVRTTRLGSVVTLPPY